MDIQSYNAFWLDHLFVAVFAVACPIVGLTNYRKVMAKLLSGEISRRQEYKRTIVIQWVLFLMGVTLWQTQQRSWAGLGFGLQVDGRFMLAAAVLALVIVVFAMQLRAVQGADSEVQDRLAGEFESVRALMPHSTTELHAFYGLSLTAGIVEEVLWRGFLIVYLSSYTSIWMAAILSALVFGIGHAYQGIANTPKIIAVGLLFAGLYLLSGSLWLPILLHVTMDMLQGRTAYVLLHARGQSIEAGGSA